MFSQTDRAKDDFLKITNLSKLCLTLLFQITKLLAGISSLKYLNSDLFLKCRWRSFARCEILDLKPPPAEWLAHFLVDYFDWTKEDMIAIVVGDFLRLNFETLTSINGYPQVLVQYISEWLLLWIFISKKMFSSSLISFKWLQIS